MALQLPRAITKAGEHAAKSFLEYFVAHIRNPNTRAAYVHAVVTFFQWGEARGLYALAHIEPLHVAAYVEQLQGRLAAPSVKQHLAAIRRLFDWLVVRQVVPVNPAASVRGPSHTATKGKTPILAPEDARALFDRIRTDTVLGLRDRALIGVMIYSFARVSAAVGLRVDDYFPQGKRWWLRFHEKGGKEHEMPAHHTLEEYLDAYLQAAGIGAERKGPLFRAARGKTGRLTARPLLRENAFHMIRRRVKEAGITIPIGCHSFRGTGITIYLQNGGELEIAQRMAGHMSPRTTKLYDRRADEIT
ncbi:MAG: tyrosine-type recombinase/integrase, partial [Gammaproteobacteria bacterium]